MALLRTLQHHPVSHGSIDCRKRSPHGERYQQPEYAQDLKTPASKEGQYEDEHDTPSDLTCPRRCARDDRRNAKQSREAWESRPTLDALNQAQPRGSYSRHRRMPHGRDLLGPPNTADKLRRPPVRLHSPQPVTGRRP